MTAGAFDHIVVGSGINGLVCAALLARRGRKVALLERNARLGGCLLSAELTAPGFIHDVMATTMVLLVTSPAYAELGPALAAHGLVLCGGALPTGVLLPDGRHAVLACDRAANVGHLDAILAGDGAAFEVAMQDMLGRAPLMFGLLGGRLWSAATARLLFGQARRVGLRGLATLLGRSLVSGRAYLETTYRSELVRGLFAPWVLHCGLTPESAFGGSMAEIVAFALEAVGAPVVQGGAGRLVAAFAGLLGQHGCVVRTDADVDRVLLSERGAAAGVALSDGTILHARSVICSASPQQLYGRLLRDTAWPADVTAGLAAHRHGRGNMQMHYALRSPVAWAEPALRRVALLHLSAGLDGVSRASNEAERGLLPAEPTICIGQPTVQDPTRAPAGQAVLWVQLPDCPRVLKGDAGGEIPIPADGGWTEAVREAFADRVEAAIVRHAPGFRDSVIARCVCSPADLEAMNINLVGGDPYGGFCGIDQFLLWRPFKSSVNHGTHVAGLYHIGAATHPGPGLAGGSGLLVANMLARGRWRQRSLDAVRNAM